MAFPPFNPPRSSQGNEQSTPIYNGNCIVTAKGQYHYLPPSATYEGFLGSMIFYRGLYEWIPVDIAPATVTRAIPGDGQISFMDGYGSLVAVHFLPPTTPAALETLTFPHELMSESTYQTSVPSNPNEAISGRYRSVPNTSSALATIPPPNDPSVSRLPVLSHTPKLFPSVVGSHSYQIIEGDIEDSEADKYIIPTGSKSFKCIAPVCTVHKTRTLDCPSTCTLKPCNETLHKTKIMARIHLRGHYQKEQRFLCTDCEDATFRREGDAKKHRDSKNVPKGKAKAK